MTGNATKSGYLRYTFAYRKRIVQKSNPACRLAGTFLGIFIQGWHTSRGKMHYRHCLPRRRVSFFIYEAADRDGRRVLSIGRGDHERVGQRRRDYLAGGMAGKEVESKKKVSENWSGNRFA